MNLYPRNQFTMSLQLYLEVTLNFGISRLIHRRHSFIMTVVLL